MHTITICNTYIYNDEPIRTGNQWKLWKKRTRTIKTESMSKQSWF